MSMYAPINTGQPNGGVGGMAGQDYYDDRDAAGASFADGSSGGGPLTATDAAKRLLADTNDVGSPQSGGGGAPPGGAAAANRIAAQLAKLRGGPAGGMSNGGGGGPRSAEVSLNGNGGYRAPGMEGGGGVMGGGPVPTGPTASSSMMSTSIDSLGGSTSFAPVTLPPEPTRGLGDSYSYVSGGSDAMGGSTPFLTGGGGYSGVGSDAEQYNMMAYGKQAAIDLMTCLGKICGEIHVRFSALPIWGQAVTGGLLVVLVVKMFL